MQITQKKIRSLDPEWSLFRGSTVLLEPMGIEFGASGAKEIFGDLYRLIDEAMPEDAWKEKFGFCRLPAETYHVTLADLVNDGNVHRIPASIRSSFGLRNVELGREYPQELQNIVIESGLLNSPIAPVRWSVKGLEIINRSVMALVVEPIECDALSDVLDARNGLKRLLKAKLNIDLQDFKPHVSVGYFANKDTADLALEESDHLSHLSKKVFDNREWSFDSGHIYTFSSMSNYARS